MADKNTFHVWPSIADIVESVNQRKTSAQQLIEKAFLQLHSTQSTYNGVISTCEKRALERAKEIDAQIARGKKVGRLAGVPFIAKDNFLTFGSETTAASNMMKGFIAPYQATAIQRLEEEGAICIAKANMDAFAHGSSTENSDYGATKNPYDISRVPGGSSGGSAAVVALGVVPFALGTDTGGSIRLPASYCGVVGYKPTYGLVSRSGVVAMASSTDVIGPITRTVADTALVLDVMSGKDELDSTTIDKDPHGYEGIGEFSISGKKIGIIKEYMDSGVDKSVRKCVDDAVHIMKNKGAIVSQISMPSLPLALAVYYVVVPAELSSNLSRHDGQRFPYSAMSNNLEESYIKSRSEGFGAEAKRRIMIGTHVLSSGYYDAYYKKAQTVRTKLLQEVEHAFQEYDFLIGPVSPTAAFPIGAYSGDPLQMYLMDIMTVSANLVGIPSISVPSGSDSDNMPIGLQLMASQRSDRQLLDFAHWYEGVLHER